MGHAATVNFSLSPSEPTGTCSTSATMSGPGVSVFGTDSAACFDRNTYVTLESTAYQPNSEYCINAAHVGHNGGGSTSACLTTPNNPRVTNVEYEQIQTDDLPIDGNPNTQGGRRIFPDKKIPAETIDRRKIRVKAQYFQATAGVRIYFRNFDVDDPSSNAAPIDVETTPNAGDDNNGTVDGTTATRGGLLSVSPTGQPNPYDCETFTDGTVSGVSCLTDATGQTKVDFTTTMQPGDNFAVVASPDETYVSSLVPDADGINLKDAADIQTPVTTTALNACATTALRACRADMLTVWRRLHLEVDSMGNVGTSNKVEGTITAVHQVPDPSCTPAPPPAPPPVPPCYPVITAYEVTTTGGTPLEVERFKDGRIVIGLEDYNVLGNTGNVIGLKGTPSLSRKNKVGKTFIIYDDDDYNEDDNLVDGDSNENIVQLPESFKFLLAEDGNYSDGNPKNVYSSAYIMPEYNWAQNVANYNQANVPFILNIENLGTTNDPLSAALENNRGSKNDEKDDFWIAYFLLAYQGNELGEDADGSNINPQTNQLEQDLANPGITKGPLTTEPPPCDCYQSSNCPAAAPPNPPPIACQQFPKGGFGSAIYQEVQQDVHRSWLMVGRTFQNIETTAPHELGHQFGLLGDRPRTTFKLMDYSVFTSNPATTVINDITLHPEHINIIRKRIKSPGH